MHWEFNIGDEVYDKSNHKNGVILLRKYQEEKDVSFHAYYINYIDCPIDINGWASPGWLRLGHKVE